MAASPACMAQSATVCSAACRPARARRPLSRAGRAAGGAAAARAGAARTARGQVVVQVREDGLQLVAQQAQPLGLRSDMLGHARLRAALAGSLSGRARFSDAQRDLTGARQVRDAGGHAGDGPARGKRAQQPDPRQHLALGRRGQRERVVRALRDRRRQARRGFLVSRAWWLGRRRGGGRFSRPAGRAGRATGPRGGLDWAPAEPRLPGRPVQPQAAPQQRQPALPRMLRRGGRRVCRAAWHASACARARCCACGFTGAAHLRAPGRPPRPRPRRRPRWCRTPRSYPPRPRPGRLASGASVSGAQSGMQPPREAQQGTCRARLSGRAPA